MVLVTGQVELGHVVRLIIGSYCYSLVILNIVMTGAVRSRCVKPYSCHLPRPLAPSAVIGAVLTMCLAVAVTAMTVCV